MTTESAVMDLNETTAHSLLVKYIAKPLGYNDCLVVYGFGVKANVGYANAGYVELVGKYRSGPEPKLVRDKDGKLVIVTSYADAFAKLSRMLFVDACLMLNERKSCLKEKMKTAKEKKNIDLDLLRFDCSLLGIDLERIATDE